VLKTLVVDDEPIARQVLRESLARVPQVLVVGDAENGQQALQQIAALKPDLVFLDLQMPVMGGFEVVRKLAGGRLPVVVIVTAFDQHAIEAFDAGAVDYLLKPVGDARLRLAVERARKLHGHPGAIARDIANIRSTERGRIVGRTGAEYVLLDAEDILAFQAERELVWIITAKQRLLATESLAGIADHFQDLGFRRVHRNAIVNVHHVRKISALSSQRWLMTLSNGVELVVSKRQASSLRNLLGW
jgi:two-component system, LytTR family, response regulator